MDRVIEKKSGKTKKYLPYIIASAIVVVFVLWLVFGDHSQSQRVDRQTVTINQVCIKEFKDYIRLNAQVIPIQVVQISPEEGGIVVERCIEEGSQVKKGDVIVRLSNSNLDLQILQAEAELAEKQNLLRNTQVAMQQDKLNNETEQASLDVDTQRKKRFYQQNSRLFEEGLISREDYLQSREDYLLASRKYSLVGQRLTQDSIYRSVQMEQMEDNLINMQRNVIMVRGRKDKLEVRSAIDGELGLLDVTLGQSISAGQMIGQINDLSSYMVEALIDEHYIDRVRQGLTASFERNGRVFELAIRKVYPEVRNGKFRTDFIFVGERPENIRSGQTYYVNLELGSPTQSVVIPRGAFFQTTGGNWIFVLNHDGSQAYKRNIRISRQNPLYYEVTEGLEEGENVITSGYEAFKETDILILK
ncbi:MAG: efflux RND transporter periplasmic adaptor subunit [Bacteroidales bacterium]|nr:efflux RND transporter periplasmic adaptor subunit [Bacteroidales bacterium]